jgi:uncharacterized protein
MGGARTGGEDPAVTAGAGWVDAHVHIFPPGLIAERESFLDRDERFACLYGSPSARMATAEEVVAHMEQTGVERSIVFGFPFRDQGLCRLVNDYVSEAVAAAPDRLAGLACVSPGRAGAVAELERCLDAGFRGCGELALGPEMEEIDSLAEVAALLRERRLPLLLHANEPVGHDYPGKGAFGPSACVACAGAYPGLKLVFAHMGGGAFVYEAMPELRDTLVDVYYDTSAVPFLYGPGIYRAAEAAAGAHKVLFGSDYPLLSPARYREGLGLLSSAAHKAVRGANARKVFEV